MRQPVKTLLGVALSALFANGNANAGAFSLYTEGSAAAIGNFAAGIAAEAADASIGWYNPAGLVLLDKQQAVFSGVGVFPSAKLTGSSNFTTKGLPDYVQSINSLQASKNAFVPAFHYALPLGSNAAFGFSVVSPFGLSTDYSKISPVRYAATFTELLTVNASPEIAGKLSDNLAIGLGLDLQWSQVKFNQMLGAPTLGKFIGQGPTAFDSLSYNKGRSFGVGFHAGVMTMSDDNHTRIGLNYQSKIRHNFDGYSELSGRLADPTLANPMATFRSNSLYSNDIEFPDVATLSVYRDVNDKLALLGSAVYSGWHVFKSIQLNNVAAFSQTQGPVFVDSVATQNYQDSWRFALGANYKINQAFMMRAGIGFDETPTVNSERDVRLPDASRTALSIGAHYQFKPNVALDFGYSYLFANSNTKINKTNILSETSAYNITANAKPHVHLIGLQAVWLMDADKPQFTK